MAIGQGRENRLRGGPELLRLRTAKKPLPPWPFPPNVPAETHPGTDRFLPALKRALRSVSLLAAGLFLWMALLDFPQRAFGLNFDESWAQALGHFLKHHFQAGVDYIFTYGPLGYFLPPTYDPDLFWHKYAWEIVVKAVFAMTLLKLTRGYSSHLARLTCCWLLAALAGQILAVSADAVYMAIILAHFLFLMHPSGSRGTASQGISVSILALLALVKFSFLLFSVAGLILVTLHRTAVRRNLGALLPAGGFGAFFMLGWLVLGQHPGNLPRYLRGSLEISTGYFAAMAVKGAGGEIYLALVITLLLGAACLACPVAVHLTRRRVTCGALVGLSVFALWKQGFVRHDHHSVGFFAFMLVLPFCFPAAFPTYRWRSPMRAALLGAAVVLSGLGVEMSLRHNGMEHSFDPLRLTARACERVRRNLRATLAPSRMRRGLEAQRAALAAEHRLPRIRAVVQGAPVDMLSYELGAVFLNELNWQPRPVFQSYSAFSPALLAANARFYRGSRAPEYVIFKLQTLDDRPPAMDDSVTLLDFFRTYRPVLAEKSYVLFRRQPEPPPDAAAPQRVRLERLIGFNEEVALGDGGGLPQKIAFRVRSSSQGKLLALLYKPSPLLIRMRTATGRELSYRLIPGMVRNGFLINPLLVDNTDVLRLYGAPPRDKVVFVNIVADAETQRDYLPQIEMTLETLPGLAHLGRTPNLANPELASP
jgi:hypothetical protein